MKRVQYAMALNVGSEPRMLEGEAVGDFLAVRRESGCWMIDHVPTGRLVGTYPNETSAMIVAESVKNAPGLATADGSGPCGVPTEIVAYLREVNGCVRAWPLGGTKPVPPRVSICITLHADCNMGVPELWPDDDWPDVIDKAAVEDLIENAGGLRAVLRDWNLEDSIEMSVSVYHPKVTTP